jgi:hypothetical protein
MDKMPAESRGAFVTRLLLIRTLLPAFAVSGNNVSPKAKISSLYPSRSFIYETCFGPLINLDRLPQIELQLF